MTESWTQCRVVRSATTCLLTARFADLANLDVSVGLVAADPILVTRSATFRRRTLVPRRGLLSRRGHTCRRTVPTGSISLNAALLLGIAYPAGAEATPYILRTQRPRPDRDTPARQHATSIVVHKTVPRVSDRLS